MVYFIAIWFPGSGGIVITKKVLGTGILLILLALICSTCAGPPLQIGSPAPRFTLPDLNGRQVSLDEFKGRIVMLDFWATWCSPCRMTMPLLGNLEKEYRGTMTLLAINLQEPKDVVRGYVQQQNINSQVLLDENGSVGEVYGTGEIPMQVLIDKNGIVRHVQIGFRADMATRLRSEIQSLLR
jgi:thiol-disulfide isomerase/thioredoxin